MSARRTRQVLIVLATLVFTVLFVLFRRLEPERFVDPDQRAPLLEVLQQVQGGDLSWLPSTWASEALWRHVGLVPQDGWPLVLLATAAAALFFVTGWLFRALHPIAFSQAQQASGAGKSTENREPVTRRTLGQLVERLSARRDPSTRATIARKDLRVFIRDTAQWTQMLLLGALVAIYVVNFSYIRTAGQSGIISANGLHFINLALGGLRGGRRVRQVRVPGDLARGPRVLDRADLAQPLDRSAARQVALARDAAVRGGRVSRRGHERMARLGRRADHRGDPDRRPAGRRSGRARARALVLASRGSTSTMPPRSRPGSAACSTCSSGLALLVVVVMLAVAPTLVLGQWLAHDYLPSVGRLVGSSALGLLAVGLPVATGAIAVRIGARHLQREGIGA